MSENRDIYCCGCEALTEARLTTGAEVYPHRADLAGLPFWRCDSCKNFVGCHHKTKNRTKPLGCIPTPEIKNARQHIHRLLDPIWQRGDMDRTALYAKIAQQLGRKTYHTANIRSIGEARNVYRIVREIRDDMNAEVIE